MHNHLICSIDTETSGLDPLIHDIWSLAIAPLSQDNISRHLKLKPLYLEFKPINLDTISEQAVKVNKMDVHHLIKYFLTLKEGRNKIIEWVKECKKIEHFTKIQPLGHNFAFDANFIRKAFVTLDNYQDYFDYHCLDTSIMANNINHICFKNHRKHKFNSISLVNVAKDMGIPVPPNTHNALVDANLTIDVYRELTKLYESRGY